MHSMGTTCKLDSRGKLDSHGKLDALSKLGKLVVTRDTLGKLDELEDWVPNKNNCLHAHAAI